MLKNGFKWARRIVIVGTVVTLVRRTLGSRSPRAANETVPTIGGDTWPPVPVNPDHHD